MQKLPYIRLLILFFCCYFLGIKTVEIAIIVEAYVPRAVSVMAIFVLMFAWVAGENKKHRFEAILLG